MLRARASTEHRRGAPARDFRSDDDGSAALEFILVGLVLLVPIVYLVIALGAIVGLTETVSRASLEQAVLARVPKGTEDKNRKALDLGFQLAKQA